MITVEAGVGRRGGECVDGDLRLLGLKREWAQDRVRWKGLISGNRPTRAGTGWTVKPMMMMMNNLPNNHSGSKDLRMLMLMFNA